MAETYLQNSNQRIRDLEFQLQHVLEPIEKSRQEIKKRFKPFWIITTLFLLTSIFPISYFKPMIVAWLALVVIVACVIYYKMIASPKDRLKNTLNQNIISHIIAEFLTDSSFSAEQFISENEYSYSGLFRKKINLYNGENLISGTLGQTSLRFSKLCTQYEKGSGKNRRCRTIFKGILLIADNNKHFSGCTYILPDIAERRLGGVGRWFQEKVGSSERGELVYMENPVFEKLYVVYATDPVEARYLLSPAMQEYFIELSDYIGRGLVHASFINGKLYLALSGKFDLFPLSLNKSLTEQRAIKHYTENLLQILKVVEILDLNTRIWGK